MTSLLHDLIYQPLYNSLVFLYVSLPWQDLGVAIIILTVILRFILIPFYSEQIHSQKKLQALQPRIKEIQQKYKDNKEQQTRELMAFYKQEKINPFSGCLPLIIQLIVFFAIYNVLMTLSKAGLVVDSAELYSFLSHPGNINHLFLGAVDLSVPSPILGILAAAAQYYQTKMLLDVHQKNTQKQEQKDTAADFGQAMGRSMLYVGPIITLFIGFTFAAGLTLYWLTSTVFMLVQQFFTPREEARAQQQKVS